MGNSGHGSPNLNQSRENEIRNDGIQERNEIANNENQNFIAEKEKDNTKIIEEQQNEIKTAPEGDQNGNQLKENEIQQDFNKKEQENNVSNQNQDQPTQENQYNFEECNIINNPFYVGNEINYYGQNYGQGQNNTNNNEDFNKEKTEENQQQHHFENPFGVIENNGGMEKQEEKK